MKPIVIGDHDTLVGTPEKPGKVAWLRENGIKVDGVQVISLAKDLLPRNLEVYAEKMADLVKKIPDLKRLSVAFNCWPKFKTITDDQTIDVAASTLLTEDLYTPALFICDTLQTIRGTHGIAVDISYHPMLTVPTRLIPRLDPRFHQQFLWNCETTRRKEFKKLLRYYGIEDVGINIENEPTTSDAWGNLTHTGNRLFSEQLYDFPLDWGITADLQHLGMILKCLEDSNKYPLVFPPFGYNNANLWDWESQINFLPSANRNSITFHVAQMEDPLRHVTPNLRFDDPIMPWPLILRLMKKLDKSRGGNTWYAIEQNGGENFPDGYKADLVAFQYLQDYFGR